MLSLMIAVCNGARAGSAVDAYERFRALKDRSIKSSADQPSTEKSPIKVKTGKAERPQVRETVPVKKVDLPRQVASESAPVESSLSPALAASPAAPTFPADDYLTGDWGGTRARAAEAGYEFEFGYKGEFGKVVKGGVEQKQSYVDNLDVKLAVDLEKAVGWSGWSFLIYGLGNSGANGGHTPSAHVGDRQVTSNIEAPVDDFRIFELQVKKNWNEDRSSIIIGLYDLASEFYSTGSSGVFLNSSFGPGHELAQTGVLGPSIFPYAAPAVRVAVTDGSGTYLQSAVLSAVAGNAETQKGNLVVWGPDQGSLVITEAGQTWPRGERLGKLAFGGWMYTKTVDHLSYTLTDPAANTVAEQATNAGAYVLLDVPVTESFSVFTRYGVANPNVNEVATNLQAGANWQGPFTARPKDQLGLGLTRVTASELFKEVELGAGNELRNDEMTWELTYRFELGSGLAIQPDVQVVSGPSFSKTIEEATVTSLRFDVAF
ncbi:MAG: carbohydrate porin [Bdellovibrio sp.]